MLTLTSRQKQVAQLIKDGFCNKEIAVQLGITESTVKHLCCAVYLKTGASGRLALSRMCHEGEVLTNLPHPLDGPNRFQKKYESLKEEEARLSKHLRFIQAQIRATEEFLKIEKIV